MQNSFEQRCLRPASGAACPGTYPYPDTVTDLHPYPDLPLDPRRGYIFLGFAIVTEVTGSVSLRGALDRPWLYAVVIIAFTIAFWLLTLVLRAGIGIGVAYGIWGASGVALTAVASMVIFAEPVTPVMWAGIALIILGVACIELGAAKRRAPDPPAGGAQ